ncbi:Hypothetical predicted protein [Xyrichtys novacula]|uniref:Uncharacterized protein n=1 Tax=Xyrichtys novacula TaxID=13765 RepID=A0AAV1GHN0_XYRNO|nr:Hypothetical predicted protein [Xyrichtys novacula]
MMKVRRLRSLTQTSRHFPSETERPTFNHQTHCYIKKPPPHKPACCLLLSNEPWSPIDESRWAVAVPESAQIGQRGQKMRDELEKNRKKGREKQHESMSLGLCGSALSIM